MTRAAEVPLDNPDPIVLANAPSGAKERRIATAVIAVSLALFFAVSPFAQIKLKAVWAFMPIYETALIATDTTTVLLLIAQARTTRSKALLVLAAGYLFSACMTVAHGLSFPGLFTSTGLLGAGPQTTAWIYMFWHGGFPLFVIAYALLRGKSGDQLPSRSGMPIVVTATLVIVAVVAMTLVATVGHDGLPRIMNGSSRTSTLIVAVVIVWLMSLAALTVLWRRRARTVLDVWLSVVMIAWLLDIALASVLNGTRFDVGFYAGRIYGLLATSFVLGVLLVENGLLYGRLARSHAQERTRAIDLQKLTGRLEAANAQLGDANTALREQTRQKSEFLANMSHELRTPLNAIIGFSDLMRGGMAGDADNQRVYAGHIYQSGLHLLALINDILDLSKVEAGKMELALEPVDVGAAIGDVVAMLAEQAKKRNVALELTVPALHEHVYVDPRRLKQILLNLVSNALKFTPEGGRVSVEATMVTRRGVEGPPPGYPAGTRLPLPASDFADFLQVSVSDTGIGLSPDDMKSLFSPFTQVANAVTKSIEGTGLGLVMVHQLARLHRGTVAVTSEPGEGSCFTIWLPWRGMADNAIVESHAATTPMGHRPGRRALVVEDDDKAAELMRLQLEAEGLQVRRVASAEAAIACASEFTPDLITLDILLPGMDGWEFLERVQQIPAWKNVPVVVVSVVADEGRGFSLGASLVLHKPVRRDALQQGLDRLGLLKETGRERAVLVIDDDPAAVDLLAVHLNAMDCIVLRAFGGREGIELAKRFEPELITLDLEMPGVNGFDVVEALKAQPSTAGIPIIVITGKDLSAADRQSLNGYVLDIVGKAEFNHGRFIGEVRRAMALAA